MLTPNKHTDITVSVPYVAGLILKELKEKEILRYDELLYSLIQKTDERVKAVYIQANSFLFLLGKIEYLKELDAIKLL